MNFEDVQGFVRGVLTEHLLALLQALRRSSDKKMVVIVHMASSGKEMFKDPTVTPVSSLINQAAIVRDIATLPVDFDRQMVVIVDWQGAASWAFAWHPGRMFGDEKQLDERTLTNVKVFDQGTDWFKGFTASRKKKGSDFARLFDSYPVSIPLGQYRLRSRDMEKTPWVMQRALISNNPLMFQLILLNRAHHFMPGYQQSDSVLDQTDLSSSIAPAGSIICLVLQPLQMDEHKKSPEANSDDDDKNKSISMVDMWQTWVKSPHWGCADITSVMDNKMREKKTLGTDLAYRAFKGDMVTGVLIVRRVDTPDPRDGKLICATQVERAFVAPNVPGRDDILRGMSTLAELAAMDHNARQLIVANPKVEHAADKASYETAFPASAGYHHVVGGGDGDKPSAVYAWKAIEG